MLRNHYGNYTNPCELVNTADHDSSKCPVCIKWSKTKKIGLALKVPLSTEDFAREFNDRTYTDFNFKDFIEAFGFKYAAKINWSSLQSLQNALL